ncbi:DUF86 domain-containing protein [Candidatus Woesearchaeota archaeon]|nr:DUF86 domain-containing protein [Candidatus Woesearchaeota archaeon]
MIRIKDKVNEIHRYLEELGSIIPSTFEEYKSSIEKKAACERYFEKIVEAMTDLAFLAIKERKLGIPEDDIDAFKILLENKAIDNDLAAKLKNAKGMRNIISHQYGKIDDEIVFESIAEEIARDGKKFAKEIENWLNK